MRGLNHMVPTFAIAFDERRADAIHHAPAKVRERRTRQTGLAEGDGGGAVEEARIIIRNGNLAACWAGVAARYGVDRVDGRAE